MTLTDLVSKALRTSALGLALYISGCGGSSSSGCQTDYDCREPRVCRQGECIDPNEGEGEAEAEGDTVPWYEGMCDDIAATSCEDTCQGYELDIFDRYKDCQDNCSSYPPREPELCTIFYCLTTTVMSARSVQTNAQMFSECYQRFGLPSSSYSGMCRDYREAFLNIERETGQSTCFTDSTVIETMYQQCLQSCDPQTHYDIENAFAGCVNIYCSLQQQHPSQYFFSRRCLGNSPNTAHRDCTRSFGLDE